MTLRLVFTIVLALSIATIAPQAPEPTPAQLAWMKTNAVEIATVEAGTGFADLQKLKGWIGDARVVSLGEATHGTREIFLMKHRMTEFLASELGFTVFAIEANMPEAYLLNDYVLHGTGDPKALLKGMYFWTWNTEEVLGMIKWMREFNASGKGRIQFTGFDMQTIRVAEQVVRAFLTKVDSTYEVTARTIYKEAESVKPTQAAFGVAIGTFPAAMAAGKKIKFSGAIRTRNVDDYAGLWWRADGPTGTLILDNMSTRGSTGTSDWKRYEVVLDVPPETTRINFGALMPGAGTAWFDDLQLEIDGKPYDPTGLFDFDFESGQLKGFTTNSPGYQIVVDDAVASRGTRSLRMQSGAIAPSASPSVDLAAISRKTGQVVEVMEKARGEYLKLADAKVVDWAIQNARIVHQYAQMKAGEVSRDESMARNIRWILDTAPKGTRLVVWAHNGHVGRMEQGSFRAMGAYLNDWYGKDSVVVGFALNRGEYTAVGRGTGLGRHQLAAAEAGSYEYAFARAGIPRFIVDLRAARADDPASAWLLTPLKFRSIGAVALDQQFQQMNLRAVFDLVVFLDETTPTRAVGSVP